MRFAEAGELSSQDLDLRDQCGRLIELPAVVRGADANIEGIAGRDFAMFFEEVESFEPLPDVLGSHIPQPAQGGYSTKARYPV